MKNKFYRVFKKDGHYFTFVCVTSNPLFTHNSENYVFQDVDNVETLLTLNNLKDIIK